MGIRVTNIIIYKVSSPTPSALADTQYPNTQCSDTLYPNTQYPTPSVLTASTPIASTATPSALADTQFSNTQCSSWHPVLQHPVI